MSNRHDGHCRLEDGRTVTAAPRPHGKGAGYGGEGVDAVHAEDMSLVPLGGGAYRMYYAACDRDGNWCIASAVTE